MTNNWILNPMDNVMILEPSELSTAVGERTPQGHPLLVPGACFSNNVSRRCPNNVDGSSFQLLTCCDNRGRKCGAGMAACIALIA